MPISSPYYGFLNKRVRYAIESATARYPIIVIKLAMVEAPNARSAAKGEYGFYSVVFNVGS